MYWLFNGNFVCYPCFKLFLNSVNFSKPRSLCGSSIQSATVLGTTLFIAVAVSKSLSSFKKFKVILRCSNPVIEVHRLLVTKILGPTFLLTQIFLWPTFLGAYIIFGLNIFLSKHFYDKMFFKTTYCIGPNFFWTQNLFEPNTFLDLHFFGDPDFLNTTILWTQNFFRPNIFLDPIFVGQKIFDLFDYPKRMLT